MISSTKDRLEGMREQKHVDPVYIDVAVDFLRTYADRCHNGKEENTLFRDLAKKQLSYEHKMQGRPSECWKLPKRVTSKDKGGALGDVIHILRQLIGFYPMHIEKEEGHFFPSSMEYFTKQG